MFDAPALPWPGLSRPSRFVRHVLPPPGERGGSSPRMTIHSERKTQGPAPCGRPPPSTREQAQLHAGRASRSRQAARGLPGLVPCVTGCLSVLAFTWCRFTFAEPTVPWRMTLPWRALCRAAWRTCLRCFLTLLLAGLAGMAVSVVAAGAVVVAGAAGAPATSNGAVSIVAATNVAAIFLNMFSVLFTFRSC